MRRVLILGGTAEALDLAEAASALGDLHVITSLAGRTRSPRLPPGEVQIGGFGGSAGLMHYLVEQRIERVVDATHPFAARMSANAHAACRSADVPRLRLLRPAWPRHADDRWLEVAGLAEAAKILPALGRRALLTIGSTETEPFTSCAGVVLFMRSIEPPARLPAPDAVWLPGRGPFELDDELALLRRHAIDVLVTKASGGLATYPKIEAARLLGLPVVMVRRPPPPPGPVVHVVADALDWLVNGCPQDAPFTGRST